MIINKTEVDEQIKKLGFVLFAVHRDTGTSIYHNSDDHKVILQCVNNCREECLIYSNSISEDHDYFGQSFNRPMGMSLDETLIFSKKLEELLNDSEKM